MGAVMEFAWGGCIIIGFMGGAHWRTEELRSHHRRIEEHAVMHLLSLHLHLLLLLLLGHHLVHAFAAAGQGETPGDDHRHRRRRV